MYLLAWVLQWRCSGWQPACTDPSDPLPSGLDWPICPWFLSQLASVISTEKTAPKSSWLLKTNQTKFLITSMYNLLPRGSLKVPFSSWGQPETFLRLSGICCTSSAAGPGWSPHSLWFIGLNFAFSLATSLPLSVLVWVKNLPLTALEGMSHAALHKIKGREHP